MKILEAEILEKFFAAFPEMRWCAQRTSAGSITFFLAKDWELLFFTESIDSTNGVTLEVTLAVKSTPIFVDKWTTVTFTNDAIRFKFFMTCLRQAGRMFLS
jgi:hypothetical protein